MDRKEYGYNGVMDFKKFWVLLEAKKHNKQWLINNGIHRATVYKILYNENLSCEVLCNLCRLLECQPDDIMEYKPNGKPKPREK